MCHLLLTHSLTHSLLPLAVAKRLCAQQQKTISLSLPCGKLFVFNHELKYHCSDCFTWLDQLRTHLLKSHNEGTWFTCHICQKNFCHNSNFKTVLLCYEAVKPYVCSECPKCFFTATELRCHHPVHSKYKQFSCGLCDRLFKHKEHVKRHFKNVLLN